MYGHHRELHVRTPSVPTRRSSDLVGGAQDRQRIIDDDQSLACGAARETVSVVIDRGGFANEQRVELGNMAIVALVEKFDIEANTRSEEHTSELQSLMRNSYAVFCLKKKKKTIKLTK